MKTRSRPTGTGGEKAASTGAPLAAVAVAAAVAEKDWKENNNNNNNNNKIECQKKTQQSHKARLPRDLKAIVAMKDWVKSKMHGQDITTNVSLRVLRGALKMQEEYLQQLKKMEGGDDAHAGASTAKNKVKCPNIRGTICSLFAISERNYSAILGNYLNERTIYSSGKTGEGRTGNTQAKETRIPNTKAMAINIREFVTQRRVTRERTTAKQVMDYLVAQKHIFIPLDSDGSYKKKDYNSAYRNVRRLVAKLGYVLKHHTGNMVPSTELILKRHAYLKAFHDNRAKPKEERLREVYVDESYIHEHYRQNDDSIWDPNDDQDVNCKEAPTKGLQYYFAAAIQGPSWKGKGSGGLVPGSLWKFCPQKKGDNNGDNHEKFDSTNYMKWWTNQLLPNLQEPSLIILDNASYHCSRHPDTPKPSKMKKQACIDFLANKCPDLATVRLTFVQLHEEVKRYIEAKIPLEIVRLAEEKGHKVLFAPPCHSDLQPIELVWALVKENIGRQYSAETTLEMVNQRLEAEFQKLQDDGQAAIEKVIEKCASIAKKMYDDAMEDDGGDNGDDDEEEEEEEEDEDPMAVERLEESTEHYDKEDSEDDGSEFGFTLAEI